MKLVTGQWRIAWNSPYSLKTSAWKLSRLAEFMHVFCVFEAIVNEMPQLP
jgi:hypothetical protein